MFCSSLRKRREWTTVPSTLLALRQPKWQEKSLETHDVCIPIPRTSRQDHQECFLFLLLSLSDLEPSISTMGRIQRIHHQGGSRQVGVVFLLQEKEKNDNGTIAMMNLQVSLQGAFEMPIIPLYNIASLQPTLMGFQRQLVAARSTPIPANPYTVLLPYCSNNPPIPERAWNILSEMCSSIPELSVLATSRDGQQSLRDMLPESMVAGERIAQIAEDIIEFWQEEILLE